MRRIAVCTLLLAITFSAKAETVSECQARLKDSLECYITQAKFQLKLCSMKIELALISNAHDFVLAGGAPLAGLINNERDFACISEAKRDVEPFFSAANRALAQRKSAQALLKDAQAYWLSSVTALLPNSDETKFGYKQRLQQREQGFDEKANRVLLEK